MVGQDVDANLKYVSKEWARTKWRYRFQRNGVKTTIKGDFGSPEFMAHYAELLGETPHPQGVLRGSIGWLVGLFLRDREALVGAGLASHLTLKGHRHHLGKLVDQHGSKDAAMPRAKLIEFLDQYTATPGARDNLRKSISALYEWGIYQELITCENPAAKIKRINTKSSGFYTCTLEDVQRFLACHGHGTTARRAMMLCICATPRREDLRLLGRQHETVIDGVKSLRWRQSKAPHKDVAIPMLKMLQDEVKGHQNATYLLTSEGVPYTHGGIGNAFQRWFKQAGAKGTIHGIRKGIPSILTGMGVTAYELDVLLGHELGSEQTKIYTQAAQRSEIALSLSRKMEQMGRKIAP